MKIKIVIFLLALVTAAIILFQLQKQKDMRADNERMTQQIARLQADNESLSNRLATGSGDSQRLADDRMNEVLRLRGEVASLRQKNSRADSFPQPQKRPLPQAGTSSMAQLSPGDQLELTRFHTVDALKNIELAMKIYAGDHNDQYPTNFNQMKDELGGATNFNGISLDHFEFFNVGTVNDSMPEAINFRTQEPLQDSHGGWIQIYGLDDGSVQTVYGDTADSERFTDFERQHSPSNQ